MSDNLKRKEAVIRRLLRLAGRRSNDGVKLAYLSAERADEIDGMDLDAVKEFKRHGDSVEVKLVDKLEILDKVYELIQDGEDEDILALMGATGGKNPSAPV